MIYYIKKNNRQYNNHGYEAEPQLVVDVMPLHSLQYLRSFNVFYIGLHYLSLLLMQIYFDVAYNKHPSIFR